MNIDYRKYLKYKKKYLEAKSEYEQAGGNKDLSTPTSTPTPTLPPTPPTPTSTPTLPPTPPTPTLPPTPTFPPVSGSTGLVSSVSASAPKNEEKEEKEEDKKEEKEEKVEDKKEEKEEDKKEQVGGSLIDDISVTEFYIKRLTLSLILQYCNCFTFSFCSFNKSEFLGKIIFFDTFILLLF